MSELESINELVDEDSGIQLTKDVTQKWAYLDVEDDEPLLLGVSFRISVNHTLGYIRDDSIQSYMAAVSLSNEV